MLRVVEREGWEPDSWGLCPHGIPLIYGECGDCQEIRREALEEDMHDQWWSDTESEWWAALVQKEGDAFVKAEQRRNHPGSRSR